MNQKNLKEQSQQKKFSYRAIALLMSFGLLLNFILSAGFEFPKTIADAEDDKLYFSPVQTTVIGQPITKYNYTITAKGETYDQTSETPITITAAPDTSIDLSLAMNYIFDNPSIVEAIKNNGGYIYYQLPTNITFDHNYFGENSKVWDSRYANEVWGGAEVPSGYYSIWNGEQADGTKTNPLLAIHFTPDYVKYFSKNNYLEGTIEFEGKIKRDETLEGDQTLNFANGPEVIIDFAKDKVTVEKKNAEAKKDESGNAYLEWTVTVKNPKGRTDLTGYSLSDILNNENFSLSSENCTVDPSGDGSFSDGTYVFSGKSEGQYSETYTFKYKQTNVSAGTEYTNKATLTGGDEPETAEATGKIENTLSVDKSGIPDYQDTGERNETINWTIEVQNKSGDSLANAKAFLVDTAFDNMKAGSLTVVDSDGNTMTEGTDYEIISGKVFYNENNNLTDVTNPSTKIDPTGSLPQIYIDENGNYIKVNTITENTNVGFRDYVIYNINGEITNYHYSEDDVLYFTNSWEKIDTSNYIIENGKLYQNNNGEKGEELTNYHKVKDKDEYYNNNGLITDYCWKDDVLYGTNGEHTAGYAVLVKNGKVYDIQTWDIENLTANNKIINSSILQFKGDSSTASAKITYSTPVTDLDKTTLSSVSQYNKVYTGSESENPPSNTSKDYTVEYKNELLILKKEADDGFDEETETFKWKLKVYANATSKGSDGKATIDSKSLETIDGCTIKDEMFKSVTEKALNSSFNCIMNNGDETTAYCKYVTITKVSDTEIKFTIDKTAMETAGETAIISGIELFYNGSASNTLDNTTKGEDNLTEYERYQNHQAVTKQNTATANKDGYTSSDTAGITAQTRFSATKQFTGTKETIVEQNVSNQTKELPWKVSLIKDQGFNKDSVVLVDTLNTVTIKENETVDTSDKVLHYITQAQLDSIVLEGRTTQLGERTTIDSSYYTVTPKTKTIGENSFITGFEIKFNEEIDTANYHYIDVTYSSTASLKDVEAGWKTTFSNGCDFGDSHPSETSITYEHEDVNKAKPTALKIGKTWQDYDDIYNTRPETIKVKVLYALENSNEWSYWKDTDTDEDKIFEIPVSDNMVVGEDFPQWKAITDTDGNGTATVRYKYKVEEVLEEDSAYTPSEVNPVTATGDTTLLNLTNTLTKPMYNKIPENSSMNTSQIEKVTVKETLTGGIETNVEYYRFKWKINLNLTQNNNSSTIKTFVDTMPNGFVYLTDELCQSYFNNDNYKTVYTYKDNTTAKASDFTQEYHTGESVLASGNTITFNLRENIKSIEYYTMIRADELERAMTNGTITNKVRLQEKGETDKTAVVTITDVTPTDNENIKKMYKGGSQGILRYSLDFNPQGKKLSNTKFVDITDVLKYETESNDTLENLKFALTSLKVYSYNADGSYTELSKSDYRYSVSYSNVSDVVSLSCEKVNGRDNVWKLSGWEKGKQVTVTVNATDDGYRSYGIKQYNWNNDGTNSAKDNTNKDGGYFGESSNLNFNKGIGTVTFTVNDDTESILLFKWNGQNGDAVSAKTTVDIPEGTLKNTPATLHLEVPDQKYLRIEYAYTVTGYTEAEEGSNNNTNVIVSNTASFQTENSAGYDTSDHNSMNVDHSSATSNTKTHPQIYKVDANSLSIDELSAKFKVLKYDNENNQWIYASEIKQITGEGVSTREILFTNGAVQGTTINGDSPTLEFTEPPTDGSSAPVTANHKFTLETNAIYKFIEVEAPEGYRQPPATENIADYDEFTFYFAYALSGNIPDELSTVANRIVSVVQDGRFDIPNSKYVSISAKKQFSGKTTDIPETATVNLQLYWSYNRDGTEINSFTTDFPIQTEYKTTFSAAQTINYTKNGSNTVTWNGLPDGYNGKPVYYFVKELSYSYTKDEETITANSNDNFTGGKFKPIYVNNGTNSNGDTITVNNASGLVIKKVWLNSSGSEIAPPKEVDSTVGSLQNSISIGFTLTAKVKETGDTVTLKIDEKLNSANSYEYAIEANQTVQDTNGTEYSLSQLENFAITENLTDVQQSEIGEKYVFSPAYELSNNMGVIKLVNTSTIPENISVSVQKIWTGNRSDEVTVQLYRTTIGGLSSTRIGLLPALPDTTETAESVGSPEKLNSGNNFTKTWDSLPSSDTNGVQYYYYVKETSPFTGVTTEYEVSVTNTQQKTVITNRVGTNITVEKVWAEGTDNAYKKAVTAKLMWKTQYSEWSDYTGTPNTVELSSENDWKSYFVNLPESDTSGNKYSYKVVETKAGSIDNPADMFTITYGDNNGNGVDFATSQTQTITITNEVKKISLKVKKEWEGTPQSTVQVQVKRSVNTSVVPVVTTIENQPDVTEPQVSFDPITLHNNDNTYPINNNVSSITITFSTVSSSGGIDFYINNDWSKWFQMNGTDLTAQHGSGPETYSVSGNTITINFETDGRIVNDIIFGAKNMNDGDSWVISNITYVKADSNSSSEGTTTQTVTVEQNFAKSSDIGLITLSKTFPANSKVTLNLSDEQNNSSTYFKVTISGNTSDGWQNMKEYEGYLDDDHKGTATINISQEIWDTQVQLWWYNGSDWTTLKLDSYTVTAGSSNRPKIPVSSYMSDYQQTKQTANQNTNNSISSDMVLSKMMGGRSGTVKKIMNMKDVYENFAFGEIIQFFYDNANVDEILVETLTISADENWQVSKEYPVYAPNGQPYYYWVEETSIDGYEVSYSFNDNDGDTIYCINAENAGDSSVTIKNTEKTSEETSLPEAGGNGTRPYTSAGMALIALSFTIPYIKHRKRRSRYSA